MSIFVYNKQNNFLYQKIYEYLPYINILTNNNDQLSADIFIYNITLDSTDDENLNVILKKYQNENIIILLDISITYNIPSFISNYEIVYYNTEDENFFIPIINKIKEKIISKEYYYYKYL